MAQTGLEPVDESHQPETFFLKNSLKLNVVMKIFEIVKQSGRSIQSSKLRSGLTLLAISVGVFAIISATTAVKVLDTYFKETMAIMGGDVITLTRFPTVNMGNTDWEFYRNRDRITFDQMERLQEFLPESREVGPNENFAMTRVFYGTEQTEPNVQLQGANIHYVSNNAYNIAEGRNFLQEDIDNARRLAIIGADSHFQTAPATDPLQIGRAHV